MLASTEKAAILVETYKYSNAHSIYCRGNKPPLHENDLAGVNLDDLLYDKLSCKNEHLSAPLQLWSRREMEQQGNDPSSIPSQSSLPICSSGQGSWSEEFAPLLQSTQTCRLCVGLCNMSHEYAAAKLGHFQKAYG